MKSVLKIFRKFSASGSFGGLLLMGSVLISLLVANSAWGASYAHFLTQQVGFNGAGLALKYSLLNWINDGLMAVFFLMVGLEIKRELIEGELASFKKAALPILAALGGVVVPATIYFVINRGTPTAVGWGIPMATDIAFALAIITLLGKRIPAALKVFLAALAIVDDLCAILVIALFYSTELHVGYLVYAGILFALLIVFNRLGIKHLAFYLIPGLVMWYFVHHSGIHATIAGVLTALTLPTTPDDTESPLEKLEHALLKPVNFVIMPLFALANTNIRFESGMVDGLTTTMGLGILLGLLVGKPLGISLFSWMAVKAGLGLLPTGARWRHLIGVGILGGIGFTMSVFIALLSFPDQVLISSEAKFAVLTASVLSGLIGYIFLRIVGQEKEFSSES
ncbi:Na+/H+ antiporter NhaA [Larkinella bovis]|uniref:Na(+)/H(+) antiporter NhaA n=1 Tax=Larkinella bovis TaxID=683041 RepID=A0ABW0IJB1_9BACT